jgi:hypothetical protein
MNTYDVFALANDLKRANVSEAQIEAFVKFEKAKDENYLNTLATKKDLDSTVELIRKDIKIIDERTKNIFWVIGIVGFINILPSIITLTKQLILLSK